jgi:2-polyprenyl-3-methyl-5-hydroxy-6-metoxy-1,4-benzoquinol methylase
VGAGELASTGPVAPSRSDVLTAAWREYFRRAHESPAHPAARDFMNADLRDALVRLIPSDARVLEVGCGWGDLIAALPQAVRAGIDMVPENITEARQRHPDVTFEVGDVLRTATLPGAGGGAAGTPAAGWDAIVCDRLVHSVLDVKALLEGLDALMVEDGRIYLTVFNFLWELPTRVAERLGWKRPAPTANWLSDADFRNLFDLTGLEVVRMEDRLMLPVEVAGVSTALNQILARVPPLERLTLYRIYVLRRRRHRAPARPISVSVVVPARNEAGNIQAAIDRTPVMGARTELIFVEGNSTDDTWATIERCVAAYRGPLQLSAYRQPGKGKGDAVRLGFERATGDLLMILDADLTVPPEDLPSFFEVAARGQADFVQGTRLVYPMEARAMRFFNKIGNVAFSRLFTYLLQQPIRDTLCGTKVLWRKDYQRIAANRAYFGDFDPFGDFDLIFGAARLNLKIAEIPVRYRDRTYGETNISRWKHGVLLLKMSAIAARKLKFV